MSVQPNSSRGDHLSFSCHAFTIGMFMRSVCSSVCHRVRMALFRYEVYPISKTNPAIRVEKYDKKCNYIIDYYFIIE